MPRFTHLQRVPGLATLAALAASFAAIGLLTALYSVWLGVTNPTIVALSFLLVVLIVAAISTRSVAIATSLLAFFCFNYFFLPPVLTWTIADPENWVALFSLLAVSIIASHLSAQARRRAREATASRDELVRLFELTRDILLVTDTSNAMTTVASRIAERFGVRAAICLPGVEGWQIHSASTGGPDIDGARLDRACNEMAEGSPDTKAGKRRGAFHVRIESAGPDIWLVPVRAGRRTPGWLALQGDALTSGTRDAVAGVTAIAIERTQLLEEREEAEVVRRSAELRSALLASLGHDLKTPLTAVTVAANNLDASWLTPEQRSEQIGIVRAELERLDRLLHDIVEMARIETNAVAPEREWVEPAEIVEAATHQAAPSLSSHALKADIRCDKMLVRLDPRLTSAALSHLLENAAQYSPAGSDIVVDVWLSSDTLHIAVRDNGAGISPEDFDRLFERSYRGRAARTKRFGTGMGLAITKGLLAAEGGRVWAENRPGGGASFTLAVPVENRATASLEHEVS